MLDFLNNNAGFVAILGVIVGWMLSSLTSLILYHRQKKDDEEKDQKERFKHKGELLASDGTNIPTERLYDAKSIDALFCSYQTSLDKNGNINIKYPKGIRNSKELKRHTIFLENIGNSDINELEIAVESPKNNVLIEKNHIDEFATKGLVNYGIILDRKIRKGEVIIVTIYYYEEDPVVSLFSASLLLFYRDSLGNVCKQPVFPKQSKSYEPTPITREKWCEHVNVDKNLEYWQKALG